MISLLESQNLAKENKMLLELFEQTEGVIYQLQFDSKSNTYNFPFCSKGSITLLELTPEQIKNDIHLVFQRICSIDTQKVYDALQESIKTFSNWSYDFRVLLPKQGIKWLRANGSIKKGQQDNYFWNGYIYDITSQKKTEKELIDSKHRLQFALEGSQDGVWDWNVRTDETYYSDTSIRMIGFEPDEIEQTAHFWNDRVHEEDRETYYADIEKHIQGMSPYYSNEHRILCKDNTYKWILDRGKVIKRDKQGAPIRVIGTHSDITSQKRKEKEFLKTIDVIENQNERLLNFAHIVSHNLRTYSGNFQSLLTMIAMGDTIAEKLEYFQYLEEVSSGLSETIDHLNEIVSIQTQVSQKKEAISIYDLIEKIRIILGREIENSNAIIHNNVPEHLRIDYIPAYIESIVFNLISNAIKYRHPERTPMISIDTISTGKQLILEVSDNGIGINLNRHQNKLFGMYNTFHGNQDAKGIGLFITKNQLVSMGDSIVVRSEVDKGTSFQVTFNNKLSKPNES